MNAQTKKIWEFLTFSLLSNIFLYDAMDSLFLDKTILLDTLLIKKFIAYVVVAQILTGFFLFKRSEFTEQPRVYRVVLLYLESLFLLFIFMVIFYALTYFVSNEFKILIQILMPVYVTIGMVGFIYYLVELITSMFELKK